MTFELGSILAGSAAIITGIVTSIITSLYNKKNLLISIKKFELAQKNFEEEVVNSKKSELYNSVAQDIVAFLQLTSIYSINTYYRKAILKEQLEDSVHYINEVYNCIEKIKLHSCRIIVFDILLNNELKEDIQKCEKFSIEILEDLIDLKVAIDSLSKKNNEQEMSLSESLNAHGTMQTIDNLKKSMDKYYLFHCTIEKELLLHNENLKNNLKTIMHL